LQLREVDGAVAQLEACLATKQKETDEIETAKRALLHAARDVLSEWLDAAHGQSITDLSVFDALSKTYWLLSRTQSNTKHLPVVADMRRSSSRTWHDSMSSRPMCSRACPSMCPR
jgi:hypothetical protein